MSLGLRDRARDHRRLYEIDTRAWLAELSVRHGRPIRLGDVTETDLAPIIELGFDLVWLMGVWKTGTAGRRLWRASPTVRAERARLLPDGSDADIAGSPFAVADYIVAPELGGEAGLARFRGRLREMGAGLVLDFVPNHTALDHSWVRSHPERFVSANLAARAAEPASIFRVRGRGDRWIAHGRDPYFPAWPDTAQLDYRRTDTREAMTDVLRQIAARCDGVRCDMAMLLLDDVFRSTWEGRSSPPPDEGRARGEFWPNVIEAVRAEHPEFVFIAEAYWGLEWRLQQHGFDYTYDKVLLDRLAAGDGAGVAAHLRADDEYQRRSVRFLENHDEQRAAARFASAQHRAAGLVTVAAPGLLLAHDGQLEGARLKPVVQLRRRPAEPVDEELRHFYVDLLVATSADAFQRGRSARLDPSPAWQGNPSHEAFVARSWIGPRRSRRVAVVNLARTPGQCLLRVPTDGLTGRTVVLRDLLGPVTYRRDLDEITTRGLYLDLPAYGYHLFRVTTADS